MPFFIAVQNPTLSDLLDHLDHAVSVAGIDHVGLGSDFDGGGDLVGYAYSRVTVDYTGSTSSLRTMAGFGAG